ncbi:hypothetical protein MPSEU_000470600 [Mayamaea pseudoterrestris]|nr:hypothetical protein MPSEU_000470600 [Mayamaea pseudoterrestris]
MDELPKDLLIGVSPLVFAVTTMADAGSNPGNSKRSLFNRFLDAVAASLSDEDSIEQDAVQSSSSEPRIRSSMSLFRPDEDESSDEEDYELLGDGATASTQKRKPNSSSFYAGFGRRSMSATSANDFDKSPANEGTRLGDTTISYAKALKNGQGFFQRARIVSVSMQHGLPPCNDPEGTDNLASALTPFLKNKDPKLGKLLLETYPLNGILTTGWLEKHVHALPSVILVVCTVCADQKEQDIADKRLLETISNFEVSMVPKRQCTIHVVGLMMDDVTILQGEEWTRAISRMMLDEETKTAATDWFRVALLRTSSDLEASDTGLPTSRALRELHQSVRDASMQYYLGQARRTKEKLRKLQFEKSRRHGQDAVPKSLLPLVIRYCFKIAMFYEFQWKHEKSLRFMAAAYRQAANYNEYLLHLRQHPGETDNGGDDSGHSISIAGDELEVSLGNIANGSLEAVWNQIVAQPPDDMIHQCRAVAEWLNLKLLQAGFSSHTEGGLLAADRQWRQHCRRFCSRQHSPLFKSNDWFEWAYIARNWLTMSEIVERHPPKALGDFGNDYDEVLLRCSPWRSYEKTVDAMLHLASAIENARRITELSDTLDLEDPLRRRYIGSFGNKGLRSILSECCKSDYRVRARDLAYRAIMLYEAECEKEKRGFYAEDRTMERSTSRAGARLYYLAGSILLGMGQHKEAALHLEKSTRFAYGWPGIELAIRKMLIECYEKHIPSSSNTNEESNQALVSMILDSYFNAKMSAQSLRRALDHFATMAGGKGFLDWYHESDDEEDKSLPFTFAVSFPERTHATAGDSVKASVLITSNLDYAVHVNSAVLLSLAGELAISTVDLLSAENASEGHDGGIIIQSKTSIIIATEVELPQDTSFIAIDDSGNGGENQGVAGKGSFAKSARPRSAGVTSAGGARFVSEDDSSLGNRVSQGWSLRFLGGKSLRCDGVRLTFHPVQVEKATGGEPVTLIHLTLKKKKAKTPANIKRTPYEEDNYIASAWSRPTHLPLSRGPRSLRVLGPQSELTVKDITEAVTGGKATEGTVNRIVVKLTAGEKERCKDIQCKISCFSVLLTTAGTTLRLVTENDNIISRGEGSACMSDPNVRTPCLVTPTSDVFELPHESTFGYKLPIGWKMAESGTAFVAPIVHSLQSSESAFVQMNLYRPPPAIQNSLNDKDQVGDASVCKTDFYLSISYQKERPPKDVTKRPGMRRASRRRAKPVMSRQKSDSDEPFESPENEEHYYVSEATPKALRFEEVNLEYTGTVVWSKPLSAKFESSSSDDSLGCRKTRSESLVLTNGDTATIRCIFEAYNEKAKTDTEVVAIRAQPSETDEALITLSSPKHVESVEGSLYHAEANDPCSVLSLGSRRSVAYTVKGILKPSASTSQAIISLGSLIVDWQPSLVPLPIDASCFFKDSGISTHGPLRLSTPSKLSFAGPRCRIEQSPVQVKLLPLPATPFVNAPFQIRYRICNNSGYQQDVRVQISDQVRPVCNNVSSLYFSGITKGDIRLTSRETTIVSYTALATTTGKANLPSIKMFLTRDGSCIVDIPAREVCILPAERRSENHIVQSRSLDT